MATRFWVGGTGAWDAATTTHWAATSGGASGASAPTAADDVVFDANSNTGTTAFTVTLSGSPACLSLSTGGAGGALDGAMTLACSAALSISGNLTLPAANFATSGISALTFISTTGTKTITTNAVSLTCGFTFNGVAGTFQLQDALTTTGTVTLTNGALDLNNLNLTCNAFNANNSNTRSVAFGSTGTITLTGIGNLTVLAITTATNFSFTGTSSIQVTGNPSTGTRAIYFGATTLGGSGGVETNAPNVTISGGQAGSSLQFGGSAVRDLTITAGCASAIDATTVRVFGNLSIGANATAVSLGSNNAIAMSATSGTKTISISPAINRELGINGAGGTFQLLGSYTSNGALRLTAGTLDLNGFTLTVTTVLTAAGTKNLTFNGGSLAVTGSGATAFNNAAPTNFTTTAGTAAGIISMTSASAKTFVGGGSTYAAKISQDGAGALTITGSNTFTAMGNTVQPASILFTAGTTTTFTDSTAFSISGTSGNQLTIGSVTAANHTLTMASGIVNVSFCDISRSQATGGAVWYSLLTNGNVDNGNNSGWIFTFPAPGSFFPLFL